ncbi:dolichyl-phosphate-mannose--protein mannosyltransferase, partial [Dactylosporangium sucinum]
FLMFWIVVAFYFLVLDREQRRAGVLASLEGGRQPGIPWYRVACAVSLGLACGVKWSGLWYLVLFAVAVAVFDLGARRSAGLRLRPVPAAGWALAVVGIAALAYLATWWGWFASDDGYFRHWSDNALVSLWHYHREAYGFHTTLDTPHPYQSWPWQWLLLGRPVLLYWTGDATCGGPNCASSILLLGTPLLWWSFLPALFGLAWLATARRDGRAWLVLLAALAGILPWFQSMPAHRTMFSFYALPAEPFLVLAVVYVLGAIIGPPQSDHRRTGALVAGAYVLLVAACFAYFYPIFSGMDITYTQWLSRMWLGSRWI